MVKLDQKIDQRFHQVNNLFMLDDEKNISREFSSSFYAYFKSLFKDHDKFERYFLGIKNVFRITEAGGKRVLDAGCGYGLITISMALLGVNEIIGIDESMDMIEVSNKMISRLNPPLQNIRVEAGDALNLSYANDSFDVVIALSLLSHLRNLEPFFIEVRRVLKSRGRLYIAMDNNSFDIRGRVFRRKFWRMVEFGPVNSPLQPYSFSEKRKEIIRQQHPSIKQEQLDFLTEQTRGMWGEQISKAVREFMKGGKITQEASSQYRDPLTGQLPESELNPFKLIKLLRNFGFQAKVIKPFSCYTYPFKNFALKTKKDISPLMKIYIKKFVKLCYPISLLLSPTVEIIAIKK